MEFLIFVGTLLLIALCAYLWMDKSKIQTAALEVPFIGHLIQYFWDPVEFLIRNSKKYKGIFKFSLGGKNIVVLTKGFYKKQYYRVDDSILDSKAALDDFSFKISLTRKENDISSHSRITKIKFSNDLSRNFSKFSSQIKNTMEYELNQLKQSGKAQFEVFDFMKRVILRSTINIFMGPTFEEKYPNFVDDYIDYQNSFSKALIKSILLPKIFSRKYTEIASNKRSYLVDKMIPYIEFKKSETQNIKEEEMDYIHTFIMNFEKSLDSASIADSIFNLLSVGSTSPAVTLSQLILFILNDKEILQNVYDEIKKSNIDLDTVQFNEIKTSFPYIDACIKEVLRLISHPLGSMRKVVNPWTIETELGGKYYIPVGYYVGTSHIVSCMDPNIFYKPNKFIPSRWIDDPELEKRNRYDYTPFSSGHHACPGRRLAFVLIKIALITLLLGRAPDKFELVGKLPPLCFKSHQLGVRKGKCFIKIKE